MENLDKQTFFAYAIRMYNNPSCSGMEEFREDLLRIKYVKRLIRKYVKTGEINPRLLLNHLIGMSNVFRPEAVSRLLFFKLQPAEWPALKSALVFLDLMPESIPSVGGKDLLSDGIKTDALLDDMLASNNR